MGLKLALGPLLRAQGCGVRRRALRVAHGCAVGQRAGGQRCGWPGPTRRWLATLDAIHALALQQAGVHRSSHSGLAPLDRFALLPQPWRSVPGRVAWRLNLALKRHLADPPARGLEHELVDRHGGDAALGDAPVRRR